MSRGKRYSGEGKLNYKKVFAVIIAFIVIIVAIITIKNILSKAKNTNQAKATNYFALYKDEKWGVIGSNGEIVVEPSYQEMIIIVDSSKDVFLCTYDINEQDGSYKTKVINKTGEEIFTEFDKVEALENYDESGNLWYEENVLKVQNNGKWGLIDLSGKKLKSTDYDEITTLKGVKNSIILEKDGLVGLVNNKGAEILNTDYTQVKNFGEDYKNGYITVNSEDKYGLVNSSGKTILENKYDKIEPIYHDKYYAVVENGENKIINENGETVVTGDFGEIRQMATSGAVFVKNNKYGLMGFDGNIKINTTYEELKEINTDIFLAKKDGKMGVIDIQENEKIAFAYEEIAYDKKAGIYIADDENFNSSIIDSNFEVKLVGILSELNTEDGYMKLKIDSEEDYKYYNFKFEEKTKTEILSSNKIFVSKQNDRYGFVDSKGNKVVDYIYDEALELNQYGFAAVKKDGKWGAIDSKGNTIIEPCYNLNDNLVIDFIGKYHLGLDLNMNYYCDK